MDTFDTQRIEIDMRNCFVIFISLVFGNTYAPNPKVDQNKNGPKRILKSELFMLFTGNKPRNIESIYFCMFHRRNYRKKSFDNDCDRTTAT